MRLLDFAAVDEAPVLQDDRLRETRRPRREVDRRLVLREHRNRRRRRDAELHERVIALREDRTVLADVKARLHLRHLVRNLFDAADELRSEHERLGIRQVQAVLDLVRRVAEVERHGHAARLEDAKVNRQPLKAVHKQDRDLVALLIAAREEEVREAVRLLVELLPRQLLAVSPVWNGLDKIRLLPGPVLSVVRRVDFDQRHVIAPFEGVPFQYLG